jgi:hypothetical protein
MCHGIRCAHTDQCGRGQLKCDGTGAGNQILPFGEIDESIKIGRRRQFSRLLAAKVCVSAAVMLDTTCSEVVRRVLEVWGRK